MTKFKGKLKKRFQDNKSVRFEAIPEPETEAEDLGVVRTKKIDLQPMDVEEAALQMEMGGHDFFVYEDEETGFVKVLYRRNDGGYGLLETSK